jgi:hypothetical protein
MGINMKDGVEAAVRATPIFAVAIPIRRNITTNKNPSALQPTTMNSS